MSKKVPVQRGAINPNPKTLKTMTPSETARQDADMHRLRQSGQECGYMSPKQNIK